MSSYAKFQLNEKQTGKG